MIKTYTISHNLSLDTFFSAYKYLLNQMVSDIWDQIQWNVKPIKCKKQTRIFPTIPNYSFKKSMRNQYITTWNYAKHWVDSAIKTAFSIINSWKKNYIKGNRKQNKPIVKRSFVRVKQTLMKLEGERLRITIKPREFVYIDLSKRYFKLEGNLGEPILTPTKIHLPIEENRIDKMPQSMIGWDSNKLSLDGFSDNRGWIKVDLQPLHTIHVTYDNKMRNINRIYTKNKSKGKKLYKKYRNRERNRVKNYLCNLVKKIASIDAIHGFEALKKQKMNRKHRRKWNRELNHTDWRKIVLLMKNRAYVIEVNPAYTSKICPRCGEINKALKGERIFACSTCGLKIDRQLSGSININLRMRGVSPRKEYFDTKIVGRFPLIGAETSTSNELARRLDELMKPQVYICVPLGT